MEQDVLTDLMEKTIREVRETLMMDKASAEKTWNIRVESVEQYKMSRSIALLDAMRFFIDATRDQTKKEVPEWCDTPDTDTEVLNGE